MIGPSVGAGLVAGPISGLHRSVTERVPDGSGIELTGAERGSPGGDLLRMLEVAEVLGRHPSPLLSSCR
jgi:hypothetical protein